MTNLQSAAAATRIVATGGPRSARKAQRRTAARTRLAAAGFDLRWRRVLIPTAGSNLSRDH